MAVDYFFFIYKEICVLNPISVTNNTLFSIWMGEGFLLIMFLRKLSPQIESDYQVTAHRDKFL